MKLIDLLVQELPKRGGWPDGAAHAWADPDGEIRFRGVGPSYDFYPAIAQVDKSARVPGIFHEDTWSYIITREQYEAALAARQAPTADADGWIEWHGGKHPEDVGAGILVDVKFRGGQMATGEYYDYAWSQDGEDDDIIAYRLHQSKQDAPAWDGYGLPPVGCECELVNFYGEDFPEFVGDAGEKVRIIGNGFTNGCPVAFYEADGGRGSVLAYAVEACFRPIRTEAELKRQEAIDAIAETCRSSASNGHSAEMIYAAIEAGNIPGVKLEVTP